MENLLNYKGKAFKAIINGVECEGLLQVEEGYYFLCQNEICGGGCEDKLGFKYSYYINHGTDFDLRRNCVENLKIFDDGEICDKVIEEQIQCIIRNANNYRVVADLTSQIAAWAQIMSTTENEDIKAMGAKEIIRLQESIDNIKTNE